MEHLGFFGIIINLILATWCAVYVAQTKKASGHRILPSLQLYTVCYILLVFFILVYLYLTLNLSKQAPPKFLLDAGLLGICILELLMIYAIFVIYLIFLGKPVSRGLKIGFWGGLGLFILSFGLRFFLVSGSLKSVLYSIHFTVYDNVIALEVVLFILILIRSIKISNPREARLARSFALMYLSRYIFITLVFIFITFFTPFPRTIKMGLAMILFVYCSFIPILWIRWFFIDSADGSRGELGEGPTLDRLVEDHGISHREREILGLLLQGKSHREIEEELFISYHTVKNHIYNIYQKLDVKNRHQLFHLFAKANNS